LQAAPQRVGIGVPVAHEALDKRPGKRPTSSAKKQNRHCVSRCEVTSAAMPASRSRSAVVAKALAASSVICRLVRAGRKLSGAVKQRRSSSRLAGSPSCSSVTTWRSLGVPLKWVWISTRSRSLTISSGGLSSASAYVISCFSAASSGRPGALFSQAKWPRLNTSA